MKQFTLPCRAGEVRGILRHSHLENRILSMLPKDADVLRESYPQGKPHLEQFAALLNELVESLRDLEGGFSAAGLVDTLTPLRSLSERSHKELKAAITRVYQAEFQPEHRARELRSVADDVITKLERFLATKRTKATDVEALRQSAITLYKILQELPRGMWLWPQKESA